MGSIKLRSIGLPGDEQWDHKGKTQIVQIAVSYEPQFMRSLEFQYLEDGEIQTPAIIGCPCFSGPMFDSITFHHSDEYITTVEGFFSSTIIEMLRISTNRKTYQIFEAENPSNCRERFRFNFGGPNQFGGFHGTHTDDYVSSIGVYYERLSAPPAGYLCASQDHDQDEDASDLIYMN